MPKVPMKERVLYAVCFLVGKIARAVGYKLRRPVFGIGTGRCGSTLLYRILKSHPAIAGFPSEANELWHPCLMPYESTSLDIPPLEIDPKRFSEISVANWPAGHAERIRTIFTGFQLIAGPSKIVFVKSAMLSFMIPKILEIFPDARFIHIYRFGTSVVESLFKRNFGKYPRYGFTEQDYRAHCAKYWNACILEIEKKKMELRLEKDNQFLEISYEALVEHPRDTLRSIADFLEVNSVGYKYDITRISNQNSKTPDYRKNQEKTELLDSMSQGMKLKGYLAYQIPVSEPANRNDRLGGFK